MGEHSPKAQESSILSDAVEDCTNAVKTMTREPMVPPRLALPLTIDTHPLFSNLECHGFRCTSRFLRGAPSGIGGMHEFV